MYKWLLSFAACLLMLNACNVSPSLISKHLNPGNIPSQLFDIDLTKDTTLLLSQGTRITIPAGSIQSKNNRVKLEVKEVLTMEDIFRAGLFTASDGKALSSGGMIYINPAPGEEASVVKPLKVQMPAGSAGPDMQVYKGEVGKDGINWTEPKPVRKLGDSLVDAGSTIYQQNCSSCHHITKELTGPALYGSAARWVNKQDLYAFIRNPGNRSGDYYINEHAVQYVYCLEHRYNTPMTAFPALSDKDLDALFAYVDREGKKALGADTAEALRYSFDSCQAMLRKAEAMHREKLDRDYARNQFLKVEPNFPSSPSPKIIDNQGKQMVTITSEPADYYNIEINSFGWYNIDIPLGGLPGIMESELVIHVAGSNTSKLQPILVIPSHKTMQQGGLLDDGKSYGFFEANGKVPLPLGVQAYVLLLGEARDKEQLYFGSTAFITAQKQTLTIEPKPVTKEQLSAAFNNFRFNDITIKAQLDTNAAAMKDIERQMQAWEGAFKKYCDCYSFGELAETDSLRSVDR